MLDYKRDLLAMTKLCKTGIEIIGDIPWGTHFCQFYETKDDLLDTLIPYFKAGLENNEFCVWTVFPPHSEEEAKKALEREVPGIGNRLAKGDLEIVPHTEWYFKNGTFDLRIISVWKKKLTQALAKGYEGMRVNGSEAWVTREQWKASRAYEEKLSSLVVNQRMIVLCAYPLALIHAAELFDVACTHEFGIARRRGKWEVVEGLEMKQAWSEMRKLNGELEERIAERTRALSKANEELRREISERKRIEASLRESEERFSKAFHFMPEMAAIFRLSDWCFLDVNDPFLQKSGYKRSDITGHTGLNLGLWVDARQQERFTKMLRKAQEVRNFETVVRARSGEVVNMLLFMLPIELAGEQCILAAGYDITQRKRTEEALKKREKELEIKSSHLEEANTALKVLLRQREEDRKALEDAILANVRVTVIPYIEKLKVASLSEGQKTLLDTVESNLNDIISPFLQKIAASYAHLTPMEIQIADLTKDGKTSKEISALLGLSKRTVDTHKNNIRKKLGLSNKEVNLQAYLRSL
ncbi:MAG: MEDS domain-containing protein [Syntrophorhabdales bacterium]|jgi:PAS domain S-box-containing protein